METPQTNHSVTAVSAATICGVENVRKQMLGRYDVRSNETDSAAEHQPPCFVSSREERNSNDACREMSPSQRLAPRMGPSETNPFSSFERKCRLQLLTEQLILVTSNSLKAAERVLKTSLRWKRVDVYQSSLQKMHKSLKELQRCHPIRIVRTSHNKTPKSYNQTKHSILQTVC